MITRTCLGTAAVALFLVLPIQSPAAPLRDLPVTWTQPDGTEVTVFATGDEFQRHTVDQDGFTVLRDFNTGWLVYADLIDGRLARTDLAVGIDDPLLAGLRPGLRTPSDQIDENLYRRLTPRVSGDYTPSTGTVNNLFVFIRFFDDDILMEEAAGYELQFNGVAPGEPSMRAYFREVSLDAVDVVTTFTPPPEGKWMTAYRAPQNRRYYQVYDAVHNPTGYRNDNELQQREHALLKDALAYVEQYIPDGVDFDANDDGWFDNVIFMIQGWPDNWSDLLWPHKWEFYDEVWCKGLKVGTYNLQLSVLMLISPGTFVHEMYHSFGAPDLYHYSHDGVSAVGIWDVMDNTGLYAAQHPLAYMKWKYGAWIEDIPAVEQNQEVILAQDWTSGDQAIRINVPESANEYFIVEYRRKQGMFESSLPDSGLLVYRIDPSPAPEGNRNGPPDEVWIFRPGGFPYATGELNKAAMRTGNRTVMNEFTDPAPTLGDGTPVTLRVYDVGEAGNNIAFKVCLNPPGCGEKICGTDGCGGWCGDCTAGNYCVEGACVPCSCIDRECGDDGCGLSCGVCDDENPCTTDNCDAGICVHAPDVGAPCDDGEDCTYNDICKAMGNCEGDQYQCGVFECLESSECDGEGGCVNAYSPMSTPCDDGDPMTENDVCDNLGHCHGEPIAAQDVIIGDINWLDDIASDIVHDAEQSEIAEVTEPKGGCSQGKRHEGAGTGILMVLMILAITAMRPGRFIRMTKSHLFICLCLSMAATLVACGSGLDKTDVTTDVVTDTIQTDVPTPPQFEIRVPDPESLECELMGSPYYMSQVDYVCRIDNDVMNLELYMQISPATCGEWGVGTYSVDNVWLSIDDQIVETTGAYDYGGNHHNDTISFIYNDTWHVIWHSSIGYGWRACAPPDCMMVCDGEARCGIYDTENIARNGCERAAGGPPPELRVLCVTVNADGTLPPFQDPWTTDNPFSEEEGIMILPCLGEDTML